MGRSKIGSHNLLRPIEGFAPLPPAGADQGVRTFVFSHPTVELGGVTVLAQTSAHFLCSLEPRTTLRTMPPQQVPAPHQQHLLLQQVESREASLPRVA